MVSTPEWQGHWRKTQLSSVVPEESQTLVLEFPTVLYFTVLMLMGFKLLKVRYEL